MRWFYLFVLSIGAGGLFALLTALARTPVISEYIPPGLFYHWLIGHVDLALIIGLLSFLVFLWHRYLELEERSYELGLAYLGAFLVFLSALLGLGRGVHNNYVPTVDHPLFFAGILLFMFSFFLLSLRSLKHVRLVFEGDTFRSLLAVSVVISFLFPVTMAVSLLRTERTEEVYLFFERLYWLPGHIHQFVNATLLVGSWILLSRLSKREPPQTLKILNLLLIPFPLVFFLMTLFVSDPLSPQVRAMTTLGYAVGIGVPTLAYGVYFLIKVAFRGSFYSHVLGLSVLMYLLGASMGYLIAGSDLRIPAHYHGVIASILIALMGLTYSFLQDYTKVDSLPKLVKFQPLIYGTGMLLFVLALFWAGVYGAPRKTFGTGYIESFKVYLFMILMGVGSVMSVIGGVIFVLYSLYRTLPLVLKRNMSER